MVGRAPSGRRAAVGRGGPRASNARLRLDANSTVPDPPGRRPSPSRTSGRAGGSDRLLLSGNDCPDPIVHGHLDELSAIARACWTRVVTPPVSAPTTRSPAFADAVLMRVGCERMPLSRSTAGCSACRLPGVQPQTRSGRRRVAARSRRRTAPRQRSHEQPGGSRRMPSARANGCAPACDPQPARLAGDGRAPRRRDGRERRGPGSWLHRTPAHARRDRSRRLPRCPTGDRLGA